MGVSYMKLSNRFKLITKRVRRSSQVLNILKIFSIVLSIGFFLLSVRLFSYNVYPELKAGEINIAILLAAITSAVGCAFFAFVAKSLFMKKILKETYFYAAFVLSGSVICFIVADLFIGIYLEPNLLVGILTVVGAMLSYLVSSGSWREFCNNVWKPIFRKGWSVLAVLFLVSIPIIQIIPLASSISVSSSGTIAYTDTAIEENKEITLGGTNQTFTLTKEIPLTAQGFRIDGRIGKITNPSMEIIDLKTHLNEIKGKLSKIERCEIYFTLSNGTKVTPLTIRKGILTYSEALLRVESNSSIQVGFYFEKSALLNEQQNAQLQITFEEAMLSLGISINLP